MKKAIFTLVLSSLVIGGSPARAGMWVDKYWPMNDGDSKSFAFVMDQEPYEFTMDIQSIGPGEYELYCDSTVGSVGDFYFEKADQSVLSDYVSFYSFFDFSFDPLVIFLNDNILQNGGSVSSKTTISSSWFDQPMEGTVTVTVSKAGTVFVPAGSFSDCRNLTFKLSVTGAGSETPLSLVLAPDVGIIKFNQNFPNMKDVKAQLVGGMVGGVDVGVLALGAPKLAIKNPVNSQRVATTNNVVTATGTVSGYLPGMQVFYQFNSTPWTNAAMDGIGWSASVAAVPGTNVFNAYALDSVGRTSSVATVGFQYVVTAPLSLEAVGKGVFSPNLTNAPLEIGRAYVVTAKPAPGYALTNWTGRVNGEIILSTNKAALNFLMQSNLVLTATFVDVQKPQLKVTAPLARQRWSNDIFTVRGTAKDNGPVESVYYQVNGGEWKHDSQTADNWTNWTATVNLVAGTNVVRCYVKDMAGNCSLTNTASFTYVLTAPLQVEIVGQGTLTPNYINSPLELGRSYTVTARPAAGFGFTNWTLRMNGEVVVSTNKPIVTFLMQSNLALTATFEDVQKPLLTVTYPAAKQSLSNLLITATCRATDNVGVNAIYYQLNGGDWNNNAASNDGTNWNLTLALTPGTNTLRVCAADESGNYSLTNTLAFTCSPAPFAGFAPASLAGMKGIVTGAVFGGQVEAPFEISFGTSTFALSTTDTNSEAAAGNYTYATLNSNTVQLTTLIIMPPHEAGGKMTSILEFTNENTCVFTNISDNSLATITFEPVAKLVPSTSAILTMYRWDDLGGTGTVVLNQSQFTAYANYGTPAESLLSWGSYYFEPFSPDAAILAKRYADPGNAGTSDAMLLHFDTTSTGTFYRNSYDSGMNRSGTLTGGFEFINNINPPAGNAPMSLAGKLITVSQDGASFKVCFGECTFTVFDANTNHDNSNIQDYTYIKTGANTGILFSTMIAPPDNADLTNQSAIYLTFSSGNSGTAIHDGGQNSTFSISPANNYAPASLAGKTITSRQGGQLIGSGTFNRNGTFTFNQTGEPPEVMTYTYSQYSPLGGILVVIHGDGSSSYLQLQFTSATAGSWYETDYDPSSNYADVETGTFTVD